MNVSFNQDYKCFIYITDSGFTVWNCDPPTLRFERRMTEYSAPLFMAEMLFETNIFALVEKDTKRLLLWDDFQLKCIARLEFQESITSIRLRKEHILVTLINSAIIYKFDNPPDVLSRYETAPNMQGISAGSVGGNPAFAFPSKRVGEVSIVDLSTSDPVYIQAHTHPLFCIGLTRDGEKLATASNRGTLIRLFNTITGQLIHEFRRGIDVALVTDISFDEPGERIAVCSNKGTIHIFNLGGKNKQSALSAISGILPQYFKSEWSEITFAIPIGSRASLGTDGSILIITVDGCFCRFDFSGNCTQKIQLI